MRFVDDKGTQLAAVAAIALAILALGACSGGGGSVPNPMQQAQPASPAQSFTGALSAAGMSVTLPSVAGFTETLTVPANNAAAGTNLTVRVTNAAPGAMPALDPDMHVAIPFLYFSIGTNKDVKLNGFPGFKMTIPAGFNMGNLPVKVGYFDPIAGWKHIGDFVLSGRTVTFAPTSSAITLKADVVYYAITYTCGGPSPSPSPTSTSTTVPLAVGTQLPVPAWWGYSGDWEAAPNDAPAGTTVTLTSSVKAPAGAPSPSAKVRPLFARPPTSHFFVSVAYSSSGKDTRSSTSSGITFAKFPAVAFDLPTGFNTTGLTFKLETFDLTTGALLDTEIGTTSETSPVEVAFPGTDSPFVADTGHTYLWELVTEITATAIYAANSGNHTITAYDQNGNQITTSGAFPGATNPVGIDFDSLNGHIYVTNAFNNTITEYDLNGNQITTSGTFPNLSRPVGIAFDSSNGYHYVTNSGNSTVTVYDQNGNQITTSGTFPNLHLELADITFDSSNGYLYVVNGGPSSTITVYDKDGNQITTSGSFPNLNYPYGIAFDSSNGHLYVTNGSTTMKVYDQDGNQITTSGTFPNTDDPYPIEFDASSNHLYVGNYGNGTITVYDQDGNQVITSGTFPNLDHPGGLTIVP